ncbi:MAG: ferredoxin--NADP reductase [Cytophagales bacterium]|nr:ferredoxin--NADP reductase [Cytophagales bacterium]
MAFGLFKKKKKGSNSRFLTLTIKEVVNIAKDAVNVVFEKPDTEFNYLPGQFITLISSIDGNKIRRAYSLCSTPFEDEFPAITVKRVVDGRMSNHVNDTFKAGDTVEVMEPMGQFTTEFKEDASRKATFIGGGSGITPLISIIRSMLLKEPESQIVLIYANRNVAHVIFWEMLESLVTVNNERLKVVHILEEDTERLAELVGRPTPESIAGLVKSYELNDSEFFICGPQPMMDVVSEGLKSAEISNAAIRMESFEAGKTSSKEIIDSDEPKAASQVTIMLEGKEHVVSVSMDQGILETALDAGLDMPYSCQSGVCTACRGKCLEGEISIDDTEGLSDEELEEGYRLLCVGKPKSEKIRVEVG